MSEPPTIDAHAGALEAMNNYPPLRVTVLGSGTSTGIPVIGCDCPVCTSDDPRNKRLRSSIVIDVEGKTFLIDCGVDFREQMLRRPTPHIDAVLVTHTHADHVHGIDDLRVYSFRQSDPIPIYTAPEFIEDLRLRFNYVFNLPQKGGGVVKLDMIPIAPGELVHIAGLPILPVCVMHGKIRILGFRLGKFAYLTDCSGLPMRTHKLLDGVETLIISALRKTTHPTHFNFEQSIAAARKIGPRKVWFIHMSDSVDHAQTEAELPEWARLTYDGLVLDIE